MIRNCFLCNTANIEPVFTTTWVLPGLEPRKIGFSVCPNCGSVCQSPTVNFDEMMMFYGSMAVYTNPGRQELPSEAKIRDLDEQIQFIKRGIGQLPESVLQIGSSDGYTLSRFRDAGVNRVIGIEPGTASVEIAKRVYNIDCIHSSAEEFQVNETYELILLTHVLEHLYQPQQTLAKCRALHNETDEGFIYVEVPLMANANSLCPGFFSFEHINYYTKENLLRSLTEAGYSPISVIEHFNSNLSPVIGVLASTKAQHHYDCFVPEIEKNTNILTHYRSKEVQYWQGCLDSISSELNLSQRIFLWGAGIHTCQLVANTNLLQQFDIEGLTDTSSLKWGLRQGDWICKAPDTIEWQDGDTVIISSYASEKEIYDALQWLRDKGVTTLRLHNVDDTKAH
ncbi:class I SAM-dependent methyltransferase [Shewanella intestini]|uniref:Class I SAM-dependent methyltransferase n=1 Tax=Shewanella intestini TaxID=2017544 RepID=A0ABS5HY85_9GAMM|nr:MULTISPECIES: methyltransferase domain-containing protein [Shewanella]MBR9726731.1 class I SAM-dependent methyltransferase [Shewanella intestini]MRG34703.1 methyltransferase domain-containing protein [Shewanella sp. XMDDZSB0408]